MYMIMSTSSAKRCRVRRVEPYSPCIFDRCSAIVINVLNSVRISSLVSFQYVKSAFFREYRGSEPKPYAVVAKIALAASPTSFMVKVYFYLMGGESIIFLLELCW